MRLIDKLLHKEDIARDDSGKTYLRRWTLARFSAKFWLWKKLGIADVRIYLHKFVDDDCADLHDHPNTFISFMLYGKYKEFCWDCRDKTIKENIYKAPCVRKLPASHRHRIELVNNESAWTVVIMFPKERDWGFFIFEKGRYKWVQWKRYMTIFSKRCE